MLVEYGNLPVPYPVVWTSEEEYWVAPCPVVGWLSICQKEAPIIKNADGRACREGVPRFGQPNCMRQRRAICEDLCDLCGRPLRKTDAKFMLANFHLPSGEAIAPEPMLHEACAQMSLKHCPALRKQVSEGRLRVQRVYRWQAMVSIADDETLERFVPDWKGEPLRGLAQLKVWSSKDVTAQWT